jgi:curved DNA-binding protein CbpA
LLKCSWLCAFVRKQVGEQWFKGAKTVVQRFHGWDEGFDQIYPFTRLPWGRWRRSHCHENRLERALNGKARSALRKDSSVQRYGDKCKHGVLTDEDLGNAKDWHWC